MQRYELTDVSYAAAAEFKGARARPPAGSHVMGLMVDACSNWGVKVISAARSIAAVLVQDWEEKMHSKPKTKKNVANQLVKDYESLKLRRKITSRSNPSETQLRQAHEFNQRTTREYSIEGLQTSDIPASSAKNEAISSQTNPRVDVALPSKRLLPSRIVSRLVGREQHLHFRRNHRLHQETQEARGILPPLPRYH
jgi:hypothetical protein